jgi:hypothetical protein
VVSTAIWHASTTPSLSRIAVAAGPAGVVLGREHSGALAPVRLFRPEPTRAVVIGGSWVANLVVFRCLGHGARVTVTTASPAFWNAFKQRAGAGDDLVVQPSGGVDLTATGPSGPTGEPHLHVVDVGPTVPARAPAARWECQLTVVPNLTTAGLSPAAEADVVVATRLGSNDAELLASAARLGPADVTRLTQLHGDMFGLLASGSLRYLWFATTSIEEDLLGPPS